MTSSSRRALLRRTSRAGLGLATAALLTTGAVAHADTSAPHPDHAPAGNHPVRGISVRLHIDFPSATTRVPDRSLLPDYTVSVRCRRWDGTDIGFVSASFTSQSWTPTAQEGTLDIARIDYGPVAWCETTVAGPGIDGRHTPTVAGHFDVAGDILDPSFPVTYAVTSRVRAGDPHP